MTPIQLLSTLRRLGVEVAVDGDEIICRAQRGVLTDDLRRALVARKSEVLAFLRQAHTSVSAGIDRIERVDRGEPAELSSAQQRLWFLDRWRPSRGLYNVSEAFRLEGQLDVAGLTSAFSHVMRRHEVLRTRFVSDDGRPRAVVEEIPGIAVDLVDLRNLALEVRIARAAQLRREEASLPFDLSRAPLLRVKLFQLEDAVYELSVTLHHIVSDAWSFGVLLREMGHYYQACVRGERAVLPEPGIQYRDYAAWQRQLLAGPRLADDLAYWREQLSGVPVLDLPGDRPRPAVQTHAGALTSAVLPRALKLSLESLSRAEGVTMFMLLLAAFQVLLHRYSGEEDIAVGTAMSNRHRPELEELIGMFVNTLVLRCDLSGDPPFCELLARVRDVALGAYAHQAIPFERLVEELRTQRDLSHTPLFQVMFVHQRTLESARALDGMQTTPLGGDNGGAKFDLTVIVTESPDGLGLTAEYNTALFEAGTIARLVGHYDSLLRSIVGAPDARLSRLSMLGPEERAGLIDAWRAGDSAESVSGGGLVGRFARTAHVHADKVAVVCGDRTMTYGELDSASSRLARHLQTLGVGAETCVGLCVEPSLDLVLAILAILKAGGAYVALDPSLPAARLAYMAGDARVGIVVTGPGGEERRSAFAGLAVVSLAEGAWQSASDAALDVEIDERQLAYVLYTSGSTGVPKGVGVSHANVARLFAVTREWCGFDGADVWTLFHSHGFDFSVWELWGALLFGGRLVVVPYWVRRSPEQFHALLRDAGVTVLNQTPSALRQLRAYGGDWRDLSVRLVICGGEELRYEELTDWAQGSASGVRLINMYGITETTVHVTQCEVGAAELSGARGRVIGKPLADLRMYVLDEAFEPVPQGVPGELYVGGGGVARGYVARPALTASRFVPDPYGGEPGSRLYRTGDVVRYLGGGEYAYVGRADRQVKIRGHRIELGEVEAALLTQPGVREAVVEHSARDGGMDRLVAYVVGEPREVGVLRAALADRLPVYMLPSAYVWLDRLPMTAHGKVDRAALPKPVSDRPALGARYEAASSEAERTLAAIWQQVLGVNRVGIHDSFFSLGGDSIRSLQVQALAEKRSLRFSLEQLFRHPTIHALATALGATPDSPQLMRTRPFDLVDEDERAFPPDIEDAYPLTQLQAGMLYHIILAPESNLYHNTDSFPLRMRAPFQPSQFIDAVRHLVASHPALRTSFSMTGLKRPLQLVHRRAHVDVQVRDLRDLEPDRQRAVIDAVIEREMTRRFDLTRPGLIRIYVHISSSAEVQLTITECHAILDGWSWHSNLVEILDVYARLLDGRPVSAPVDADPARPSFRDYVALEQQALASEEFAAFWREHVAQAPCLGLAGAPVPAADHRAAEHAPRIRSVSLAVPAAVQAGLGRFAESVGVGTKTVFLAAHVRTLALFASEHDVVTGVQVNGRPQGAAAEDVRGLFLNMVPFRVRIDRGSWASLAQQCFGIEQAIFPFRRYPLAQMIRDNGGRPLFQTAFNYLDFHVLGTLAGGIEIGQSRRSEGTEFPLLVHAYPQRLEVDYDSTRLSHDYAEAYGRCLLAALSAMAFEPLQWHDAGSFLDGEQRRLLLELAARADAEQPVRDVRIETGGIDGGDGTAEPPADAAPRTPVECAIAEVWQEVLGLETVGIHTSFFDLGGDSLLSLQVVAQLNQRGIRVTAKLIFEQETIERLALTADTAPAARTEQGSVTGSVPLTPVQHWFFELGLARPAHWNQAVTLDIPHHWSAEVVTRALEHLVAHHDALRLRFKASGEGWQQWHAPVETGQVLQRVRETDETSTRLAADRIAREAQTALDLSTGPLLRAVYVELGEHRPAGLIVIVHHLAVDEVSWNILLADLETLCDQLAAGAVPALPPKTTSFKYWAERLVDRASAGHFAAEKDHWLSRGAGDSHRLPRDWEDGTNEEAAADHVVLHLDEQRTSALLRELPAIHHSEITEVLLVALARVICHWTGTPSLTVDLEGHGREDLFDDVDLSRTVGWFTSLSPMTIDSDATMSLGDMLNVVRQQLRAVSARGIGHGVLRHLAGDKELASRLAARPRPELVFNYLGQRVANRNEDELPRRAASAAGVVRDPAGRRAHVLEIDSRVVSGRLEVAWIYGSRIHHRATIERVAQAYIAALRECVDLSRAGGAVRRRAPDFPLALLSQNERDSLAADLFGLPDDVTKS